MLHKFVASWLVVLVIVPFTAPFSTCDLTSVFGRSQEQHTPFAPPTSAAVSHDSTVSGVPCVSRAGRVRLLQLSGVPLAHAKIPASQVRLMPGTSAGRIWEHTVLTTILRL